VLLKKKNPARVHTHTHTHTHLNNSSKTGRVKKNPYLLSLLQSSLKTYVNQVLLYLMTLNIDMSLLLTPCIAAGIVIIF